MCVCFSATDKLFMLIEYNPMLAEVIEYLKEQIEYFNIPYPVSMVLIQHLLPDLFYFNLLFHIQQICRRL